MRQSRQKIFADAMAKTVMQTGIPSDVWLSTRNNQPCHVDARAVFVSKLPGIPTPDIMAFTGWSKHTFRGLEGRKAPESNEPRDLTDSEKWGVDQLVQSTAKKHKVEVENLNRYSDAENTTRWEIVGKLMHIAGLNRATIAEALKPHGIKVIGQDFIEGFALCMPVEGDDMATVRVKAQALDAVRDAGRRDLGLQRELAAMTGGVGSDAGIGSSMALFEGVV